MDIQRSAVTTGVRLKSSSYDVATATRTGLRRTNADAVWIDQPAGFFAVSDGMLDTPASGIVAQRVLDAVSELFLEPWTSVDPTERSTQEAAGRLHLGVLQAHRRIWVPSRPRRERIGATFVGVVDCGGVLCVGHVGDSRSYLLRPFKGTMAGLTEDDTVLSLAMRGGMSREEAVRQPDAHTLTQVLGVNRGANLVTSTRRWELGDIVILCTDGLSDHLETDVMAEMVLDATDLTSAAQSLVDQATSSKGLDNATVVLVRWAR